MNKKVLIIITTIIISPVKSISYDITGNSSTLSVNITKYIPNFAVENCDLKIDITLHLVYSPFIDIPFYYATTINQHYTAPY